MSAMFHDMGLTPKHSSATDRFEVGGANAAGEFLRQHKIPQQDIDTMWTSIVLAALTILLNLRRGNSETVETIRNSTTLDSKGQVCSVEQCCDSGPNRGACLSSNRRASYRSKR